MNQVDEIKQRLPIEELVWEYVQLKKAWKNFKWLCPWHQEKTPSFVVSPDSWICRCFWQCQKWGDIFKFLEYTEGLEFKEALEVLAAKAWVVLEKKDFKKSEEKTSQIEILEEINNFYKEKLREDSEIWKKARKYLEERKIFLEKWKIWDKFEIWFSPDDSSLVFSYLRKKWFEENEIFKTWVIMKNEHWSWVYDRFKWRIIFPIKNLLNKTIWFWWRIFRWEENSAKYLNSPESSVFDKSMNLYWLNFAKDEIRKQDFVVLTEWYMDTIACHKAWIENSVASLWTAFNEKHVKVLKRYTDNFYLCFDNDLAWIEAIKRAFEVLNDWETNIKIIKIPNWKDPDESIENNKEEFLEAVKNPLNIVDFLFSALQKKYDLKKIEDKKHFQKEIFEIISSSKNNLEKQEYLKKLAFLLWITENFLTQDFKNFENSSKNKKNFSKKSEEILTDKKIFSPEKYLIWLLLFEEKILEVIKENILLDFFIENDILDLYKNIFNDYNSAQILDENPEFLNLKIDIESKHEVDNLEKVKLEALSLVKTINLKNIKREENKLKKDLKNPESIKKFQEILVLKSKLKK